MDPEVHNDDFLLMSTDDLLAMPGPRPLQAYCPDISRPNDAGPRNPDITPWSDADPVGISPPSSLRFLPTPSSQPPRRSHRPFLPPSSSSSSFPISNRSRPSDARSFSSDIYVASVSEMSIADSRRGKGSLSFFSDIMKKRSRSKLASSDSINDSTSTLASFTPSPSLLSVHTFMTPIHPEPESAHTLPHPPPPKKEKKRARLNKPPPGPPKEEEPQLKIDTDFTHIEDIINKNAPSRPSASSSLDSSAPTLSSFTPPSPSSMFTDPFHPSAVVSRRRHRHERRVSPKTITEHHHDDTEQLTEREWTAPESWAIEMEGADATADGASSSSEESIPACTSRIPDDLHNATDMSAKKRMRRKTHHAHRPASSASTGKVVLVRIYRANGSYHVAQIPPHATVADITPSLNVKVLGVKERETHKLYLKERGRGMYSFLFPCLCFISLPERMLAPTERPAAITRRRLEQAGYDQLDSLDYLAAEDMTFLLKFVYKSQLLGPTVCPISIILGPCLILDRRKT